MDLELQMVFCGNVGDSRCVLYSKIQNQMYEMSEDHKPNNP